MDRKKILRETEELIFIHIGDAVKPLVKSMHKILDKAKVPLQFDQIQPLMELYKIGELSQQEIADSIGRDKSSVQRTIQNLIKMGLVTIEVDAADKRRNKVNITAKGQSLAEKIHLNAVDVNRKVTRTISKEEMAQFKSILGKIKTNAETL